MCCANWPLRSCIAFLLIGTGGCCSQVQRPAWKQAVAPISDWDPTPPSRIRQLRSQTYNPGNNRNHLVIANGTSPLVDMMSVRQDFAYSPIVVVGSVVHQQAYLSEDGLSLYTEWTIHIEHIWSQLDPPHLVSGVNIVVNRATGTLRMPPGKVLRSTVYGIEDPPSSTGRYVLFLRYDAEADWFDLDKSWRIEAGRMVAVDRWDAGSEFQGKSLQVYHRAYQALADQYVSYPQKRG
jgi:hypothetical protein